MQTLHNIINAVNDVLWDTVTSVEADGVEEVFDATVLGGHNFVANGIAVHNSIEQDADMVILLHREEAYEKETQRAGEADHLVYGGAGAGGRGLEDQGVGITSLAMAEQTMPPRE